MNLATRGVALLSGLLFGAGLLVSGMTQPEKVTGFLDVAGAWDPALALVMVGAIGTFALALPLARRWPTPAYAAGFEWPTLRDVDARLVGGSALFGVGWGLSGYCPGPALASIGAGSTGAAWFTGGMLAGMAIFAWRSAADTPENGERPRE